MSQGRPRRAPWARPGPHTHPSSHVPLPRLSNTQTCLWCEQHPASPHFPTSQLSCWPCLSLCFPRLASCPERASLLLGNDSCRGSILSYSQLRPWSTKPEGDPCPEPARPGEEALCLAPAGSCVVRKAQALTSPSLLLPLSCPSPLNTPCLPSPKPKSPGLCQCPETWGSPWTW